jgi:triose/dihydroxyacetone kinase / FAD-AMP lyase (cyclizing)
MPGFSLTLLLLPRSGEESPCPGSEILSLLDDRPNTPGWKWCSQQPPSWPTSSSTIPPQTHSTSQSKGHRLAAPDPTGFVEAIRRAAQAIIQHEAELTRLDNIVGDGDAGLTHKAGAEHILRAVQNGDIDGNDVIGSVTRIAQAAGKGMDGTSGALYSIFFSALAQGLYDSAVTGKSLTLAVWAEALRTALSKLFTYTRARPPSRTLVDPLAAFVQELEESGDFNSAVTKAAEATENTKNLEARAGRATYVEVEKVKGVVDPGALGVTVILKAMVK